MEKYISKIQCKKCKFVFMDSFPAPIEHFDDDIKKNIEINVQRTNDKIVERNYKCNSDNFLCVAESVLELAV